LSVCLCAFLVCLSLAYGGCFGCRRFIKQASATLAKAERKTRIWQQAGHDESLVRFHLLLPCAQKFLQVWSFQRSGPAFSSTCQHATLYHTIFYTITAFFFLLTTAEHVAATLKTFLNARLFYIHHQSNQSVHLLIISKFIINTTTNIIMYIYIFFFGRGI
ncbi:hypothetical protein T12_8046, partial [Trichinella patagoniensis]